MTSVSEQRTADVRRRLDAAGRAAADRHPRFAEDVRRTISRLAEGLDLAHARSEAVDDERWAGYVDSLDRGLDALDSEMSRAAEQPAGPSVPQVLTIHATGIELQGWKLRFARFENQDGDHLDDARARLAAAEAELDRYAAGAEPSAESLDKAVSSVRQAASETA